MWAAEVEVVWEATVPEAEETQLAEVPGIVAAGTDAEVVMLDTDTKDLARQLRIRAKVLRRRHVLAAANMEPVEEVNTILLPERW